MPQPTKTEAIKRFLQSSTHHDLAELYNHDMECQVNVAQDGGDRIGGEYKGKIWNGWSDGLTTWKPLRIPYNADTVPDYEDKIINFDLALHVDAIGMTGWDWKNQVSKWVAFDFDSILGHTKGLTNEELEKVKTTAIEIEWVTIRKSTSGKGLHLYVLLDNFPTENHTQHAALARSILGRMSALTGFDFQSKIDSCGGNMWVWARKMINTEGLTLVKQGEVLKDIPPNWKDHIKVITGKRRRNLPQNIEDMGQEDLFEELCGQRPRVPLDEGHKAVINFLKRANALWWWDQDHHMLVTHTIHLQEAFDELNLKGYFKTCAVGKEKGHDHNCFAFPMRKGAWGIRRYSLGVQEDDSWHQDGSGWTTCYFNREPDLATASRAFGGLEDPKGGFIFREAESAINAARLLGVELEVATALRSRTTKLKQHRDGRLIAEIDRDNMDRGDDMPKWLAKGNGPWAKIFRTQLTDPPELEIGNYDDIVRHIVTESDEDYGWMLKSDNVWRTEPITHIREALGSLGLQAKDKTGILGTCIRKAWKIVNKPFQPEYPGNREWNRSAAQFKFLPTVEKGSLSYPTWLKILNHCGMGLDEAIKDNGWCQANGITSGADYLKCWIASLFQEPTEPLPYLFFYGPQNSGKSIYHEALSLLLTKGYKRADAALVSQAGFNGELEGAIICVVEETDLKQNRAAYNRIKDWVTSRDLLIHAKNKTPYHIPNTTHWIQCANQHQACPVFPGDTRITMSFVECLNPIDLIPKKMIIPMLEKEAPDFLASILGLELPPSNDRLNIPVLATGDKIMVEQLNQTELESFIAEKCKAFDGGLIKFSDFHDKFIEWIDINEAGKWSKIRVGREMPPQYPKGRDPKTGHFYFGNICWAVSNPEKTDKLTVKEGYLVPVRK